MRVNMAQEKHTTHETNKTEKAMTKKEAIKELESLAGGHGPARQAEELKATVGLLSEQDDTPLPHDLEMAVKGLKEGAGGAKKESASSSK
jgi:hypothetical protein